MNGVKVLRQMADGVFRRKTLKSMDLGVSREPPNTYPEQYYLSVTIFTEKNNFMLILIWKRCPQLIVKFSKMSWTITYQH